MSSKEMDIPASFGSRLFTDPPDKEDLAKLQELEPWPLDHGYLEFISNFDGFDGIIANGYYISLWKLRDVISMYPYYPDSSAANDLFFFGSDGASRGFAFIKDTNLVVSVDFLDIGTKNTEIIAKDFSDFLRHINRAVNLNPT